MAFSGRVPDAALGLPPCNVSSDCPLSLVCWFASPDYALPMRCVCPAAYGLTEGPTCQTVTPAFSLHLAWAILALFFYFVLLLGNAAALLAKFRTDKSVHPLTTCCVLLCLSAIFGIAYRSLMIADMESTLNGNKCTLYSALSSYASTFVYSLLLVFVDLSVVNFGIVVHGIIVLKASPSSGGGPGRTGQWWHTREAKQLLVVQLIFVPIYLIVSFLYLARIGGAAAVFFQPLVVLLLLACLVIIFMRCARDTMVSYKLLVTISREMSSDKYQKLLELLWRIRLASIALFLVLLTAMALAISVLILELSPHFNSNVATSGWDAAEAWIFEVIDVLTLLPAYILSFFTTKMADMIFHCQRADGTLLRRVFSALKMHLDSARSPAVSFDARHKSRPGLASPGGLDSGVSPTITYNKRKALGQSLSRARPTPVDASGQVAGGGAGAAAAAAQTPMSSSAQSDQKETVVVVVSSVDDETLQVPARTSANASLKTKSSWGLFSNRGSASLALGLGDPFQGKTAVPPPANHNNNMKSLIDTVISSEEEQ